MKIFPLSLGLGCLLAVLCGITPATQADENGVHLFILSGQSNMAGLDPDLSFTPSVKEAFGESSVLVVKDALGGQPIRRWYKEWKDASGSAPENRGDLYDKLMGKVRAAIEGRKIQSVTFVWMQGERDAREEHGTVYGDSFKGLVQQLESDLHRSNINVVIGRLSDFDMENKRYPHWTKIRKVQVRLAKRNPKWNWVDTDAWNGEKNDLHYTKDGYIQLGAAFAKSALELINKQ